MSPPPPRPGRGRRDCLRATRARTRSHTPTRRRQVPRLLRVCDPFSPRFTPVARVDGVAGCVYEAAGPKLKGIQLPRRGLRGGGEGGRGRRGSEGEGEGGMQQSPTSERAYQRVILLVDAGVATSRRHWSARDPRGVVDAGLEGLSHPWQRLPEGTRGSRGGRNPAWRRPKQPLRRLRGSLSLGPPQSTTAARRRNDGVRRCRFPARSRARRISLDLSRGTLQESKVRSFD